MSGHTPGPWHVSKTGFARRGAYSCPTVYATDTDLRYIAFCSDKFTAGEPSDNLANANLISAAPEMLTALIELIDADDAWLGSRRPGRAEALIKARAAIAKATGAAP